MSHHFPIRRKHRFSLPFNFQEKTCPLIPFEFDSFLKRRTVISSENILNISFKRMGFGIDQVGQQYWSAKGSRSKAHVQAGVLKNFRGMLH